MLSPKSKLSSMHEELGVRLVAPRGIFMRFSWRSRRGPRSGGHRRDGRDTGAAAANRQSGCVDAARRQRRDRREL
jgi:hypothetical protein